MEFFTLDWGRSWLARLFGRNTLVRSSDQLEALIIAVAVVTAIVAIPLVTVHGTSVKESRSTAYAQQALSRHRATATALENATLHAQIYTQTFSVQARWAAAGAIHVGTIPVPEMVHPGDRLGIWTDNSGNFAKAPTDLHQAAIDAIGWAVFTWMSFAAFLAAVFYGFHRNFQRARFSQWDRELGALAGDDGGRTNR